MTMGILTERKTITTAGTAEQLPDFPAIKGRPIVVQAMPTNTNYISLGRTKALAEGATAFRVTSGNRVALSIGNANEVWVDAVVSGEGVELLSEI